MVRHRGASGVGHRGHTCNHLTGTRPDFFHRYFFTPSLLDGPFRGLPVIGQLDGPLRGLSVIGQLDRPLRCLPVIGQLDGPLRGLL